MSFPKTSIHEFELNKLYVNRLGVGGCNTYFIPISKRYEENKFFINYIFFEPGKTLFKEFEYPRGTDLRIYHIFQINGD